MSEERLYDLFHELNILYETIEHHPTHTVEEGRSLRHKILGLDCKNLFMKDKKDVLWLVVMPGDKRANITNIQKKVGSARLSFGNPELLKEVLGITPGSVTPFALINDTARRVKVVLDCDMLNAPMVNFHPLRNTASTSLRSTDLLKFIKSLSYEPQIVNCGTWIED
ncbi:MAG: prolyl-tRNA synthetase associated domain-containing protein [Bdellovibrionales bacterium]